MCGESRGGWGLGGEIETFGGEEQGEVFGQEEGPDGVDGEGLLNLLVV